MPEHQQIMKRGYIILFIGAVLFVGGLGLGAYVISIVEQDLNSYDLRFTEYRSPEPKLFEPNESSKKFPIPANIGERFSLEITHEPANVPVLIQVQDASTNEIVTQFNADQTKGEFSATKRTTYYYIFKNVGSQPVKETTHIVNLGVPGEIRPLYLAILAVLFFLAGIGTMALGVVKLFRERRKAITS